MSGTSRVVLCTILALLALGCWVNFIAAVDAPLADAKRLEQAEKNFAAAFAKIDDQCRESVQAAQRSRNEKLAAAQETYRTALSRAAQQQQEARKHAVASVIAAYDDRINDATKKGDLESAQGLKAAREKFITETTTKLAESTDTLNDQAPVATGPATPKMIDLAATPPYWAWCPISELEWRPGSIIKLHAPGAMRFHISKGMRRFEAVGRMQVGGNVRFVVRVDGKDLFTSEPVTQGHEIPIAVQLPENADYIELYSDPNGDTATDHALWVKPRLVK